MIGVLAGLVVVLVGRPAATWWGGRSVRTRVIVTAPRVADAANGLSGRAARWLAPHLRSADLAWPPATVARGTAIAVAALAVVAFTTRPVLAGVAAVGTGASAGLALHLARGRRDARIETELPELLESVARSLRSGAALPTALREAAATGSGAADDLVLVLAAADHGLGLADALDGWARHRPTPAVRLVVGALAVALVSGGSPARGVDGVAITLRERAEVDREARALATQARASAVVVGAAPLAFGLLGVLGDERTAEFLLGEPAGLACLTAGVALDGVGAWWMHRIAGAAS